MTMLTLELPDALAKQLALLPQETITEALADLVEGADKISFVDDSAHDARLHELIDREFLNRLTKTESQELAMLLSWRDERKSAFYRSIEAPGGTL